MDKEANREIIKFLYEAGNLKMVPRSGWFLCGIKNPESVAEHSFRAAVIAYILAKKSDANAEKAALMALFHDLHESRINDTHKVGARYENKNSAARTVIKDQAKDRKFLNEYLELMNELQGMKSREAAIVKDADSLECALQAKEYIEAGYQNAGDWLDRIGHRLKTKEAKELFKVILSTDSIEWWRDLKVQ